METVFGPPSEPIDIAAFVGSAQGLGPATSVPGSDVLTQLPKEQLSRVLAESSVADIQKSLLDIWNNPRLSAHLLKEHELTIESICTNPKKRRKAYLTDPAELPSEVVDLQKELNAVHLDSSKLQPGSAVFVRPPRNSDYNVLRQPKSLSDADLPQGTQAIIIASVYKRTVWNLGRFMRISQHALLSSQTLRQLFDAIPCPSKEIPHEIVQDGKTVGYSPNVPITDSSCVICIEGYAYGDGLSDDDYAQ
ncbi:hypothetical protein AX15_003657 [Amanita polypyramis BW_CC]|nr:hypothetical protein AX15_003657 [Amanita polypyramis BW_CC]